MSVGVRDLSRLSTPCYRLRIVLYRPILSSLGPNLGPPMEMPHWVRELRRRWRYFAPIVIWYGRFPGLRSPPVRPDFAGCHVPPASPFKRIGPPGVEARPALHDAAGGFCQTGSGIWGRQ